MIREVADLIQARSVPGLSNNLGVGQHRVFGDHLHHRRIAENVSLLVAAQYRGEVEAEAVHVHVNHPPAQRVHDQAADDRMVAVAGVAAAGEVQVGPRPRVKQVVDRVVNAPEGRSRAVPAALGSVIVHYVEDDLDPGAVQGLDHVAELAQRVAAVARIGGFGCEEGERAVAPVVF